MLSDKTMYYFHQLYESIPRQGPGEHESTLRALGVLPPLTEKHRILDIGCGSGTQTIDLAQACPAQIVAVDSHGPFIDQLKSRATLLGLEKQIDAQVGDMSALPFSDGAFDVIWSEGAVFIIGFSNGLSSWRRLLTPGGFLVVSELCWLAESTPAEVQEFCQLGDEGHITARRKAIDENGYQLLSEFALPASAWRDNYYAPLAEQLTQFREKYANEPEAMAVAGRSQRELELYRKHTSHFNYVFFVMKRID